MLRAVTERPLSTKHIKVIRVSPLSNGCCVNQWRLFDANSWLGLLWPGWASRLRLKVNSEVSSILINMDAFEQEHCQT